jgi:hypothetical protein
MRLSVLLVILSVGAAGCAKPAVPVASGRFADAEFARERAARDAREAEAFEQAVADAVEAARGEGPAERRLRAALDRVLARPVDGKVMRPLRSVVLADGTLRVAWRLEALRRTREEVLRRARIDVTRCLAVIAALPSDVHKVNFVGVGRRRDGPALSAEGAWLELTYDAGEVRRILWDEARIDTVFALADACTIDTARLRRCLACDD